MNAKKVHNEKLISATISYFEKLVHVLYRINNSKVIACTSVLTVKKIKK